MPDESLFAEEMYSDYDMCGLSNNDLETYIEKGFSTCVDNKSYDTMPAEHVTKERKDNYSSSN